ncbi:MAG: hypothetical protein H3C35_01150 [Bacteroidetes bacterium]|nr:hypothetical protein [Bacteroidota bacterium]
MNQNGQSSSTEFVDLASLNKENVTTSVVEGNILKTSSSEQTQFTFPEIQHIHESEPEVRFHKNGETIESIEFICSCGKSKTVYLEYAAE